MTTELYQDLLQREEDVMIWNHLLLNEMVATIVELHHMLPSVHSVNKMTEFNESLMPLRSVECLLYSVALKLIKQVFVQFLEEPSIFLSSILHRNVFGTSED